MTLDGLTGVAPFVGVWIEIMLLGGYDNVIQSLPSWECGLKFHCLILYSMK